ncbi:MULTISPECIES: hypothetical protein [Tetragenococcus]|uniref:Uncharacterized protein n=2 Tax=Tetragenococcus TaxID=51668 RepID=A0AAN4RK29_9ENTE|nr:MULTISPECIES: hypothetical protein [Tetragenococcus]MCF1616325.1 hypothetical protein [Tetragenococcus koreensis]MCF1621238.1 hypothetical protein [Tetragenococcus koreensis]MCF1626705.1 hypothetical protein [Tetragenococcus koreensis]MCF1631843.1 hypothetical protein [Tetragenococcus koreensis]MCF1677287.1 hypothetical protein [Tetragenococcus koreensis]
MKPTQFLRNRLEAIHLEETYEQEILNTAIEQLDNGENEFTVLKEIKAKFRKLVLNKKLSQKGLTLYTELHKPNIDVDTALSSNTWFQ